VNLPPASLQLPSAAGCFLATESNSLLNYEQLCPQSHPFTSQSVRRDHSESTTIHPSAIINTTLRQIKGNFKSGFGETKGEHKKN
jgi:hypothetical protein